MSVFFVDKPNFFLEFVIFECFKYLFYGISWWSSGETWCFTAGPGSTSAKKLKSHKQCSMAKKVFFFYSKGNTLR